MPARLIIISQAEGETTIAMIEKDNDAENAQNPAIDRENIDLMKLTNVNASENGRNIIAKEKIAQIPNNEPNTPDKTPA